MRGNIFIFLCRNGTPEGRKVVKWNVEETYTWLRKQNAVYEDYIVSGLCKPVVYEPRHDKTDKMSLCPSKSQISLGIRPVWSESSLSAWRNLGSLATHWVHSEDSDQTGWMPRLIWVFAWRTLILLVFVMSWLILFAMQTQDHDNVDQPLHSIPVLWMNLGLVLVWSFQHKIF